MAPRACGSTGSSIRSKHVTPSPRPWKQPPSIPMCRSSRWESCKRDSPSRHGGEVGSLISNRTKILGITLAACGLLLFLIGYKDYRRFQTERAELGSAYEMLVESDLYTPRTSRLFKSTLLVVGGLGLATLGSAIIDQRRFRGGISRDDPSL